MKIKSSPIEKNDPINHKLWNVIWEVAVKPNAEKVERFSPVIARGRNLRFLPNYPQWQSNKERFQNP